MFFTEPELLIREIHTSVLSEAAFAHFAVSTTEEERERHSKEISVLLKVPARMMSCGSEKRLEP